jgi:hypothetical protein
MVFGTEKCKILNIAKGKLEMRIFKTEEAMNQDDIYRYLGHMQSKQINHTNKTKVRRRISKHHKKHIKEKAE